MALPLIAAGVSLAGGIIGGLTRNASYDRGAAFRDQDEARQRQLAMFADPNSPYYQQSTANFQRQLTDASPTINSLLGVSMALGGNYGGSQVLATKQREATERRNRESAGQFAGQLYGQGLQHTRGIWQDWVNARMQGYAADKDVNMANAAKDQAIYSGIADLGGGILGDYFGGGSDPQELTHREKMSIWASQKQDEVNAWAKTLPSYGSYGNAQGNNTPSIGSGTASDPYQVGPR